MEKFQLNCLKRETSGTAAAKKVRQAGSIVGVVYAKDFNVRVSFRKDEFRKILHLHPAIENVIIEVTIANGKKNEVFPTIVKNVQYDPVYDYIVHVDFKRISLEEKIKVKVPVVARGDAIGIKSDGTVTHVLHELEVECFPQDMPEKIDVDISALDIGGSIHVSEIQVPEEVKVLHDEQDVLFSCSAHIEEPEEPVEEVVEGAEPEVIGEKKKEEEQPPEGEVVEK